MFDWNDLKYFLAVARHGSTLAAARSLKVNQSTVQRRLAELERRIGRPLATRSPVGYRLTEFGQTLLPYARSVEDAIASAERQALASGDTLSGLIRFTCPEPIVGRLIASGLLDRFHASYPGIRVDFVTSDRYLDLSRGEADVALRSGEPEDANLVGRKVADSVWAVYASRSYIQQHGRPHDLQDLKAHRLVGFEENMADHRVSRWLAEIAPDADVASRSSSVLGLLLAVKSGLGIAPLPTPIADGEDALVQLFPPIRELERGWYLLTHPDLRKQAHIAALFDFVIQELTTVRSVLMG
jgi:DNA-binding transcriptional LysR family regulator